jgi:outer membrane protein insertion porin family
MQLAEQLHIAAANLVHSGCPAYQPNATSNVPGTQEGAGSPNAWPHVMGTSIFMWVVLLALFSVSRAQELAPGPAISYEGRSVSSVEIAGRPDLDLRLLQSLIAQPVNAPYSQEKVDETVATLKSVGQFQDVELQVTPEAAGLRLLFVLQPALYFGVFDFSTASKVFSYTRLLQIANYPRQEPYTAERVTEAESSLINFFHQNGYFLATVDPKIESDKSRGVVNVFFQVALKQRARVGQVILTGASPEETARLDRSLRSISARLRGAYLKSGRTYSLKRLQDATVFLQRQLAGRNYLAAQVKLVSSKYDLQTNRADITFNITQGPEISVKTTGARVSRRTQRNQIPIYEENAVDPDLVQEGQQNLASFFQTKGFFDVEVRSSMEQHPAGTTIVYEIERGRRGKVKGVGFEDNHQFSDRELRTRVAVKPARMISFFSRGRFSRRLMTRSVASIESLYRNAGYSSVKVSPHVTRDEGNVRVVFKVEEGARDIVASLIVRGNKSIPEDKLVPKGLNLEPGRPYSQELLRKDRDQIMAAYLKEGFLVASFASEVRPRGKESHQVDVIYEVTEGPQVYTRIVDPLGAPRTNQELIVHNANIKTGKPLSASALLLGESQLYSLGIFDWANVDTRRPVGQVSQADVLVRLHEGKRNSITYGVGFQVVNRGGSVPGGSVAVPGLPVIGLPSNFQTSEETIWGPTGSIQYTRSNFRGRAESITIGGYGSRLDAQASTAWNIPNFHNSSWTANLSLSGERNAQNPLFTARLGSGILQFQKFLDADKAKTVFFRYTYSRTILTDLLIPDLVLPQDQNVRLSGFSASFVRDTRDNPTAATKGIYESIEADLYPSSLGSNTNFTRFLGQAAYYHRIFSDSTVWANSLRLGLEFTFAGAQVPLSQSFFSGGGSTLRGFPLDGAGPQRALPVCSNPADPATCSQITVPVGGPQLVILNSELRFPLGILSKLGGAVFYDGGNVYPSVGLQSFFARYSNSVGVGLRYSTPVGPVRFDVGRNLNPVPGLSATQFFLTLGQAF